MTLSQEAYRRVQDALDAGAPRKRIFSDVARELDALGYRNSRNQPLRAASIERAYYQVRRKRNGVASAQREPRWRTR